MQLKRLQHIPSSNVYLLLPLLLEILHKIDIEIPEINASCLYGIFINRTGTFILMKSLSENVNVNIVNSERLTQLSIVYLFYLFMFTNDNDYMCVCKATFLCVNCQQKIYLTK